MYAIRPPVNPTSGKDLLGAADAGSRVGLLRETIISQAVIGGLFACNLLARKSL